MAPIDSSRDLADPVAKAYRAAVAFDEAVAEMIRLDPTLAKLRASGFSATASAIIAREHPEAGKGAKVAIYTTAEVADMLGVSAQTVKRLIRAGDLASHKVGAQRRITQSQLDTYLRGTTGT
jgi:excisionase family DNA binding protein